MIKNHQEVRLTGRAVSRGIATGRAFVYRERLESLEEPYGIEEAQVEEEVRRIDKALEIVSGDLRISVKRIEGAADAQVAGIFEAHEAILQDSALREEIRALVKEELIRGCHAVAQVFRRWERKFHEMTEPVHQQHASDMADLRRRLLREMAGVKTTSLEKMPAGHILVARRLLPSDTVALPRGAATGIVLEFGGPGSHAALLAEALEIPTVAGIDSAAQRIADEEELVVDGVHGEVILHPTESTRAHYAKEMRKVRQQQVRASGVARKPAHTRDGTPVAVMANVGCQADVMSAVRNGADGVGLFRIEQYYLARKNPPTAAELLEELRKMFAPMQGKPITVRLLDLGGDKPLPFLKLPPEDNPFLGLRGVRFLMRFPELLNEQLLAFCQFSEEVDLRILVPFVTQPGDMVFVRERLGAAMKGKAPPLGAMVETPAAALSVHEMCRHADFLSIGTNDLTQFTMAAGRENPLVSDYFRDDHPAVLRLVRIVAEEAGSTPVTLCGELARQTEMISVLLQSGLRSLSVAPPLIPGVKGAIRRSDLGRHQQLAA